MNILDDAIKSTQRITPPKTYGTFQPKSAPNVVPPALQTPPTTPTSMQNQPALKSSLGSAAGRVLGGGITAAGAVNTINAENTADRVGGVAQAAQGLLTMAKPAAGLSVPVLAAAVPGMVADYFRGKYDDVPRDEVARQAQPVPPGIQDIRGPATMEYAQKRARQFNAPPQVTQATPAAAPATTAQPAAPNAAAQMFSQPITKAQTGGIQVPQLATPPAKRELPPLPQLQAGQNQNIFSALMNLNNDMGNFQSTRIANRQAQTEFNNALEAGKYNIDALSKMTNIQTTFDDNERKNLDTEIKTRAAEAARILASGQFDKAQESGLRILAGMEKGKFSPAVIYGEMDPNTGQQQKMTVAVRDDGTVVPLQVPGFNTGPSAKTVAKADFQKFVKDNGYSEAQARAYLEKQGFKVEG